MMTAPISVPSSEFNAFLFAPIGEDRNGMLVSVLSGLARIDVDPWQAAAELAKLPGEVATKKLVSMIGALPDAAASYPDPGTIAARLIALLPRTLGDNGGRRQMPTSLSVMMRSHPWWIYAGVLGFLLGSQFMMTSHQLSAGSRNAKGSAVSSVASPVPPTSSGQ